MVSVFGRLTDFAEVPLGAQRVTLRFIPNRGAISPHLMATRPVTAEIDPDGSFAVNLTPSDQTSPFVDYEIVAEWLDAARNFTSITVWQGLVVPSGGGDIATFTPARSPFDVWVGLDVPAGFTGWWLVADPTNPESETAGIGDLRRVY